MKTVTQATHFWFTFKKKFFFVNLEMGCIFARNKNEEVTTNETVPNKTYSWDGKKRSLSDLKNFIIEDLQNQEEIRLPGSINGQQFIVQNCKNSTIYILDHINTITIDDCVNCNIVLGPVEGSAFVRNCKSCTIVVACGQFRMRDSTKVNVFLFSATQPIIEASSGINFGSYQLKYKDIQEHCEKANLNLTNSNWKVIYDFTPVEYEENWNFIKNDKVSDYIPEPNMSEVKNELTKLEQSWYQMNESANEVF